MCGIAAIISRVHIIGSNICRETKFALPLDAKENFGPVLVTIDDLKIALQRRGPDCLGSKKILAQLECRNSLQTTDKSCDPTFLTRKMVACRIAYAQETTTTNEVANSMKCTAQLEFIGTLLQLRGSTPVSQPLEDSSGNLLVYNGEIFGGIHVDDDSNDSEVLLRELEKCCSFDSSKFNMNDSCNAKHGKFVPDIFSVIKGPWSFIYWQERSKTMWFGRDALGRRSLLVHWPTDTDPRFILTSVSPPSFIEKYSGLCSQNDEHNNEMSNTDTGSAHEFCYWEELPCGIYSMELKSSNEHFTNDSYLLGVIRMHRWTDPQLTKIMSWDRVLLDPKIAHGISVQTGLVPTSTNIRYDMVHCEPAQRVLSALRRSVMRRTKMKIIQTAMKQSAEVETAPVAVLFSGGLDSMILSALLDQCLNPRYVIDLLNVSFDGQFAPDRVSARLGLKELQKFAPMRRWRLVEIDATLLNLTKETKHVMSLIHPADTYMDLNIGMAIWLAARGDGWVDEQVCSSFNRNQDHYKYKSEARVLFVGSGADEQCAGYGRHRTKYMHGGWLALHEEMRVDMQRIWKRNLGRDDRLISDHGKEARFPFLDEEVIQTLLEIPLWEIARLDEPAGKGDKKILREVAQLLGLEGAAALPKRAIQFGSRIAKESNRKNFGSNRAANQASAGSAKVGLHQSLQRIRSTWEQMRNRATQGTPLLSMHVSLCFLCKPQI